MATGRASLNKNKDPPEERSLCKRVFPLFMNGTPGGSQPPNLLVRSQRINPLIIGLQSFVAEMLPKMVPIPWHQHSMIRSEHY